MPVVPGRFLLLLLAAALEPPVGQAAQPAPRALQVLVSPERPAQGQLLVIELRGALPGDLVSGSFQGRRLRFFLDARHRLRALAAVPLECPPGEVPLEIRLQPPRGEAMLHHRPVAVRAGDFEEQPLRVNPRFVKPPEAQRARILGERAEMKALFEAPPTERLWRGGFGWPRRDTITSRFGLRRTFNGRLQSRHRGLDIDGRTGSPVRAIGAGRVVMVERRYYSGGTVVIDHGLRLFSMYFHLSRFEVRVGQRVERGQRIGRVGRSGRVTGPHLHLSTKLEGVYFDPLSLIERDLGSPLDPPG